VLSCLPFRNYDFKISKKCVSCIYTRVPRLFEGGKYGYVTLFRFGKQSTQMGKSKFIL
jgi:hypothetical protein